MKKLLYIVSIVLGVCAVSCTSGEENRQYENTPAVDAVGVFAGEWECVSSTGNISNFTGEIELKLYHDTLANQCFVIIRPTDSWSTEYRGLANVAHAGDDIVFSNDKVANGMNSKFYGRIYANGDATMFFSNTGKEGRKNVVFANTFTGTRKE